jgi:hypothetical protein
LSRLELAVSNDSDTSGVLLLRPSSNYPSNRFYIEHQQTHHIIKSKLTNECVSVLRGSQEPGAVMVTLPNFGSPFQKMYLKQLHGGNDYVISTFCGLVLDCYEEGEDDGTLVIQWTETRKPNQVWTIEEV